MVPHGCLFLPRKRTLLSQHDYGTPTYIQRASGHYHKVTRRIGHSHFVQSFDRYGNYAQSFSRLLEFPSCDGDQSVRLQVLEIFAKRLDRVQIVLAEGEGPGGSRSPGIH
jgi:hypothetical protein